MNKGRQPIFLPPTNIVCEGYVFTRACHSFCSRVAVPDQVHPPGPGTPPLNQVHLPGPGNLPGPGTPLRSRAWWEIRSTCGRSASYWNAILSQFFLLKSAWKWNKLYWGRPSLSPPLDANDNCDQTVTMLQINLLPKLCWCITHVPQGPATLVVRARQWQPRRKLGVSDSRSPSCATSHMCGSCTAEVEFEFTTWAGVQGKHRNFDQ